MSHILCNSNIRTECRRKSNLNYGGEKLKILEGSFVSSILVFRSPARLVPQTLRLHGQCFRPLGHQDAKTSEFYALI